MGITTASLPGINKQVYFGSMKDLRLNMNLSAKWWNVIDEALQSQFRFWHTHHKLNLMLSDLDWCISNNIEMTERNYDLLSLVMLFCDVGFDARDDVWEIQSATLWCEFAESVGMPSHEKMAGYNLLIGLGNHIPYDTMSTVFYDADLLIYAESESTYTKFITQLRAEYQHLNDFDWSVWRLSQLDFLMDKRKIYGNDMVSSFQDKKARENIVREMHMLQPSLVIA